MGCRFELILDPEGSPHDRFGVEAIADELTELITDWHERLSIFTPTSLISRINATAPGMPVRVDRDLFELLRLCRQLCEDTHGAFNIAAGTLMHEHGFRNTPAPHPHPAPDLNDPFTLDEAALTIARANERVSLDFGAIAKGFVLDLIAQELRAYRIRRAFVHGGSSSVVAVGSQPNDLPWKVLVSEAPSVQAQLERMALGISEHAGRLNDHQQGHIMDPTTGRPAANRVKRVVCTHPSAAVADAYSTALSVRPDLIDELHEHGCSIIVLSNDAGTDEPRIRDRLGVFSPPSHN